MNQIYMLYALGWNIAWLILLLQVTKKYGGVDKVLGIINEFGSLKELKEELDEVKKKLREAEVSAGVRSSSSSEKVPKEIRMVEEIPVMHWGRREIEAALVGALKGLNEYVQGSPELAEQTKAVIKEGVNQLLLELELLGIG